MLGLQAAPGQGQWQQQQVGLQEVPSSGAGGCRASLPHGAAAQGMGSPELLHGSLFDHPFLLTEDSQTTSGSSGPARQACSKQLMCCFAATKTSHLH